MKTDPRKKYIAKYIKDYCLHHFEEMQFGKAPGTRYQAQFVLTRALYDVDFMSMAAEMFYDIILAEIGHFDFQLAGRSWTAIPILTSFPAFLTYMTTGKVKLHSFMVRDKRKNYGMNNLIEGYVKPDLPVLVVDDLCNSQTGLRYVRHVAKYEGKAKLLPCVFTIMNKYSPLEHGPRGILFDKYIGTDVKAISLVNKADVYAA